jgi:hypothetical protein
MTVLEFLRDHPGEALDLTTPDGYVYLDARQIQRLMTGRTIIAHNGGPKRAVVIPAEKLLEQDICSAYRHYGTWRVASTYDPQEDRQQHSGMMQWRLA